MYITTSKAPETELKYMDISVKSCHKTAFIARSTNAPYKQILPRIPRVTSCSSQDTRNTGHKKTACYTQAAFSLSNAQVTIVVPKHQHFDLHDQHQLQYTLHLACHL